MQIREALWNILKKEENTLTVNAGSWLGHICVVYLAVWGVVIKKRSGSCLDYVDELSAGFAVQEGKVFILHMKTAKATGYEEVVAEVRNALVVTGEGIINE